MTAPVRAPAREVQHASSPPPPPAPAQAPVTAPAPPAAGRVRPASGKVSLGKIGRAAGHRVVLFGPGGIGKTTLACLAPGPVAVIDLDESLPRLAGSLEALGVTPAVVEGVDSWTALRGAISASGWDEIKTIVIDTATRAEELAIAHMIETVPGPGGKRVKRLEDYGYGKGFQHVYDTFLPLLSDLDAHARAGRTVVMVCHDCTASTPNPMGDDWIRYEPRLQTLKGGGASVRLRVREWADHVVCITHDISVDDRKARGSGTRTAWPSEQPHCMAKSRTLAEPVVIQLGSKALWDALLK